MAGELFFFLSCSKETDSAADGRPRFLGCGCFPSRSRASATDSLKHHDIVVWNVHIFAVVAVQKPAVYDGNINKMEKKLLSKNLIIYHY